MKKRILPILLCLPMLAGCSSFLERDYSTVEPHSSKFWESDLSSTLRAENYQDIVNDLLMLIGQHAETATLRLYDYEGEMTVAEILEQATSEIRQETPMGAYAVEYITTSSRPQRSYYEISIQISYRRTEEQIRSLVNATSTEALPSLLESALAEGKPELAVRVGYWDASGPEQLRAAVDQVRETHTVENPWLTYYYPNEEQAGIIEFLLDVPPELLEQTAEDEAREADAAAPAAEGN